MLWRAACLFCAIAGLALAGLHSYRTAQARAAAVALVNEEIDRAEADKTADADVPSVAATRPVYRYSVIPGGAYTAKELTDATKRDPVVAAVYHDVAAHTVLPAIVPADRMVYMSYRMGDRIYWTSHPIRLRRGETILTDGETELRGRCGNNIAKDPMQPTADAEPDPVELEALVDTLPATHLEQSLDMLARAGSNTGAIGSPEMFTPSAPSSGGAGYPGDGLSLMPTSSSSNNGDSGNGLSNSISTILPPLFEPPGGGNGGGGPKTDDPPNLTDFPIGDTPPSGGDPGPVFTPTDTPDSPSAPLPTPEPGSMLLVGGSGAVALLRKLRAERRDRRGPADHE